MMPVPAKADRYAEGRIGRIGVIAWIAVIDRVRIGRISIAVVGRVIARPDIEAMMVMVMVPIGVPVAITVVLGFGWRCRESCRSGRDEQCCFEHNSLKRSRGRTC